MGIIREDDDNGLKVGDYVKHITKDFLAGKITKISARHVWIDGNATATTVDDFVKHEFRMVQILNEEDKKKYFHTYVSQLVLVNFNEVLLDELIAFGQDEKYKEGWQFLSKCTSELSQVDCPLPEKYILYQLMK